MLMLFFVLYLLLLTPIPTQTHIFTWQQEKNIVQCEPSFKPVKARMVHSALQKIGLTFEDIKEPIEKLLNKEALLPSKIRNALEEIYTLLEDSAKNNVPVSTGRHHKKRLQ